MNVLVKPSTKCCDFALSSKRGVHMRATVGTLLSVGWLPHVMPSSGELLQARNARPAANGPGANDLRGFSPEPFHEPRA